MTEQALRRLEKIAKQMEQLGLEEYLVYLKDRRRLFFVNFFSGLARGFGLAIGFTVLGAAVVALLQRIILESMPNISAFLADMIRIIQTKI
ncbi:MAG: hypothetical protein IJB41_02215 [Clostridia bacterium]|nr:hypothetical protein [Clostridia bacterium]